METATALLLMRIFGENDPKALQIKKLEYEFNSWALRDASGNASYQEGVLKNAAAILEAAIIELEHFWHTKTARGIRVSWSNVCKFNKGFAHRKSGEGFTFNHFLQ